MVKEFGVSTFPVPAGLAAVLFKAQVPPGSAAVRVRFFALMDFPQIFAEVTVGLKGWVGKDFLSLHDPLVFSGYLKISQAFFSKQG